MENWKANDKHACVVCHNDHGSIATGSMFGVKQHAYVSVFLGGSKFINDLWAILCDFGTLFPTCNEDKFSAEFLWVWIIFQCLAMTFDEGSFTGWTSQQSLPLYIYWPALILPWAKPVASPLPSRSAISIELSTQCLSCYWRFLTGFLSWICSRQCPKMSYCRHLSYLPRS